ncbi:transcriptional regulator [Lactococcus piscium]|uniref:Transcriptional regulator n=1 Tax=Pseudolactococcus piscium TaxID=1364 RepID=A0A2A5S031_9LACT|nr:helix-turn-helix transcriptional regulator [Lactococcus piscium]PCS06856.1 transcriptional regulator [Lactococcus piscium]
MFPERLKTLRLEAKMTQKDVSNQLKISQSTYSDWEKGKMRPKNVQQIADFFSVSTDYLLGNTNIKNQKKFDEDLEKSLDTFKSFDGKPMYDEDREKIREFIKKRMEDRLKNS